MANRITRRRMTLAVALSAVVFALSGCAARPLTVKPARALEIALAHPEVAAWYDAHSAPQVLAALNPAVARRFGGYRPAALVDLHDEGLLVRLDSALGPHPRRLAVIVDRESGSVLRVEMR